MKPLLPRRVTAMVSLSILLVLVAIILAEPPQSKTNLPGDGSLAYEASVKKLFDDVLRGVVEMRGLPPPSGTEMKIVSIEWFKEQEKRKVAEETPKINLENIVYRALFIIPEDYGVGEARVEQAGAISSAVSGTTLYVVREHFKPEDTRAAKRTLAHEVTHILQRTFRPPPLLTHDQRQAWRALIEGDADFTADTYIRRSGPFALPGTLDSIGGFPYRYGKQFIEALYDVGGWSTVNSAYGKPPRSTEEILHPEVYLAGATYSSTAALTFASPGWEAVWTNTFGEYFIRAMLQELVPSEAESAAAGWGGDNVTLYRRVDTYLVGWSISWDSGADASQFYDAYLKMLHGLGGVDVGPGIYRVKGYYVAVVRQGLSTYVASSTDRASLDSVRLGG